MGIRPFSKPPKSPSRVADVPPPVFNKHGEDDLLKGHRGALQKLSPSPLRGNVTSSTELWIAASNASARSSNKGSRRSSDGSYVEEVIEESEYFEEEIVEEEYVEEEIMEENALPPRKITIRFDEYDEMQTCLHINDYSNHEISKAWYKRNDYDKMVALARKTAEKVGERQKELGKLDRKGARKIESRGLEAWTAMGAAKVKILKESAVEAVWNEQSRQWDAGITDAQKISLLYQIVSKGAQSAAEDRGFSDALISKRIRQLELQEEEKKRRRRILGKSKALIGKSVKKTAGGVVKTAKLAGKTTKLTGKVALKTGMVAMKTSVATATLDRKMLKEAIIPAKKKKQCETQILRMPSQSNAGPGYDPSIADEDDAQSVTTEAKKKHKLKLLGLVPIPGTNKTYREDRRLGRIEKRREKQGHRPSWEAGLSAGKY